MKIYDFIAQYCQDIVKDAAEKRKLVDLSEFPYDEIKMVKGVAVPIVYIDGVEVPIRDFLMLQRRDFIFQYQSLPSAGECYDNYLENFTILEGEQALSNVRLSLMEENNRIEEDLIANGEALNIG